MDAFGFGYRHVSLEALDKLSGLRHLTILGNVPYDPRIKRNGTPRCPVVNISRMLRGTVQALKYVDWQTARVCITTSLHNVASGWNPYSGDQVRETCRIAERDLLQAWNGDVQRELEQDKKRETKERRKKRIRRQKKIDRQTKAITKRRNMAAWEAKQQEKAAQVKAKRAKQQGKEAERVKPTAEMPNGKKVSKPKSKRAATKANSSDSVRTRLGLRKVKNVNYTE